MLNALPLLILLSALSSAEERASSRGSLILRLSCYNHSSSLTLVGTPCDRHDPCDPEMRFCLSRGNAEDCEVSRAIFTFDNAPILGACSTKREPENVPDPLMTVPMETDRLNLGLTISELDRQGFFERRTMIDQLSFQIRPTALKTLPAGQEAKAKDFQAIAMITRSFSDSGRPHVEIRAVIRCAKDHYGKLCAVRCSPNSQFECLRDGSRRCRSGWIGPDCTARDFCVDRPCKPWAECHSLASSFACSCDGRTGPQCERNSDPCLNHRCAHSAPCLGVQGRPVCLCPPGLKGPLCEERDLCKPNPCAGYSRCFQTGAEFYCKCQRGRSGRLCQFTERPHSTATTRTLSTSTQSTSWPRLGSQQQQREFPIVLILIVGGSGLLAVAIIAVSISCCVRNRPHKAKKQKGSGESQMGTVSTWTREQMPLNPYNESEYIYEEADGVYSIEQPLPPTPTAKDNGQRTVVFVRQNSRC